MIVVLSGEGPSDLGHCSNSQGQCTFPDFAHGPMTLLVDRIAEERLHHSLIDNAPQAYVYVSEKSLQQMAQQRKKTGSKMSLVGKKREQETGYYYINAWMLGQATLEKTSDRDQAVGILFRDTDGTRSTIGGLWEAKLNSMLGGFERSGLGARGVPMLPKPKSEAWLLCVSKAPGYAGCHALEDRSGNDDSPNSLKNTLSKVLHGRMSAADQNDWLRTQDLDTAAIARHLPSFDAFRKRLLAALDAA